MPNFKFLWPALLVFCPKMPKFFTFFHWPNILCKILVVVHHLKKDSPFSVPKWVWNKSLLFGTFDLLNFHCLTHSAMLPFDGTCSKSTIILHQRNGIPVAEPWTYQGLWGESTCKESIISMWAENRTVNKRFIESCGGEAGLPHEVSQLNQLLSIPCRGPPPPSPHLQGSNPGPLFNGGSACHLSQTNGHSILESQNHELWYN